MRNIKTHNTTNSTTCERTTHSRLLGSSRPEILPVVRVMCNYFSDKLRPLDGVCWVQSVPWWDPLQGATQHAAQHSNELVFYFCQNGGRFSQLKKSSALPSRVLPHLICAWWNIWLQSETNHVAWIRAKAKLGREWRFFNFMDSYHHDAKKHTGRWNRRSSSQRR